MIFPDLLKPDRMHKKIDMFEEYTLPCLNAQTNQNFRTVVVVHDDIPNECYDRLNESNIMVVKCSEYGRVYYSNKYIKGLSEGSNFLIQTRLDDDDMIYDGMVDLIQKSITEKTLVKFIGFPDGATFDVVNGGLYKFDYKCVNGFSSLGTTLILNMDYYKNIDISIYSGAHKKIKTTFLERDLEKINKAHPLSEKYLASENFWEARETGFPAWIHLRHPLALGWVKGRDVHGSNIKIEKSIIDKYYTGIQTRKYAMFDIGDQ